MRDRIQTRAVIKPREKRGLAIFGRELQKKRRQDVAISGYGRRISTVPVVGDDVQEVKPDGSLGAYAGLAAQLGEHVSP